MVKIFCLYADGVVFTEENTNSGGIQEIYKIHKIDEAEVYQSYYNKKDNESFRAELALYFIKANPEILNLFLIILKRRRMFT